MSRRIDFDGANKIAKSITNYVKLDVNGFEYSGFSKEHNVHIKYVPTTLDFYSEDAFILQVEKKKGRILKYFQKLLFGEPSVYYSPKTNLQEKGLDKLFEDISYLSRVDVKN